mgnify:CR=1 FL=1
MKEEDLNKEITTCINTIQKLLDDTNQLFELPEKQRVALMKAAGLLSRPSREEFDKRKKDAKKAETPSIENNKEQVLQTHPGKKIMETECYICHNPKASEANMIAPPMIAIKTFYKGENTTKKFDCFITAHTMRFTKLILQYNI